MYFAGARPTMRRMTAEQWWLLLNAWLRLLVVDVQVRLLGVQRTARMAPRATTAEPSQQQVNRAETYMRWLRVAARHHVVTARCLHQSLALHGWLRRDGVPSTINIGVRRHGTQLFAHAWVNVGRAVIGDPNEAVGSFVKLGARGGQAWL